MARLGHISSSFDADSWNGTDSFTNRDIVKDGVDVTNDVTTAAWGKEYTFAQLALRQKYYFLLNYLFIMNCMKTTSYTHET